MANKGILGRKLGMTQVFDEGNRIVPVTVIEAGPCRVVQIKTLERDGYAAVQLALAETKSQRLSKPELGQMIAADIFEPGERVDVTGISKGNGFTGPMKRHNFSGQGASHGNHKKHRSPGSVGQCATPSRVFRGLRMAGRTGGDKVTTLNLQVVRTDLDQGLLLVRGAVPGPRGGTVIIRDAVKGGR